jgi:superfamily II DNA or RNA helicase
MVFAPGILVRLKTDPTRAGILLAGEMVLADRKMVRVQFPDGAVSWLPEVALVPVETETSPLANRFAEGQFVDPGWLRRELARSRVTGRLSNMVYSMEATETRFYSYQFKPVLKFLNSPTDGLLIADEVGLGKTIEAGLIWTELRARVESNRLLVLCPKTLCDKWRIELDRRFGVRASIVDASELVELFSSSGRSGRGYAAIASMQALRPPDGWDDPNDDGRPVSPRRRLAQFLDDAADGELLLDLLVIDEAHHMRNPETLLYRLAQLLNDVSAHRVFLSATPIHLRNRDLNSLLRLIDPNTFEFESTLEELIQMNAPIVEARDLILKSGSSTEEIIQRIESAQNYEFLANSKALELLLGELRTRPQLDKRIRAEMAFRLEQINQLANYVTRTRRRDVEEFRVRRDPQAPTLVMDPEERAFYDAATCEVTAYANEHDVNAGFLLSTPQRLLTSSPAAASKYWSAYGANNDDLPEETDHDLANENGGNERPLVARLGLLARRLDMSARLARVDTKYSLLRSQLYEVWKVESAAKVIVFSSFKPTLYYLQERFAADGISCELLHGSTVEPREIILRRFEESESTKILLSSEVGSEGVDLQFCWIVVNYDLPWNPMKLEQRIGRVDRLGQEKSVVSILNLIYADTIDEKIYKRLYVRLGLGQRALGEFEAVLGEPIRQMTNRLADPRLTEEQKIAVIDQAAVAVENLKLQEEQLESEAGSLIRHGDYILQTINESRQLHRWLDGNDILVYVRDRLYRSFPGCSIESSPPGSESYRITLSDEAIGAFGNFLAQRGLRGTTRLITNHSEQRYRFTASVITSSAGNVENVSQMHPLVRFAAELDAMDQLANRAEPVAATIRQNDLTATCTPGAYVFGVRKWRANTSGGTITASRIAYAGANLSTGEELPTDVAETFVRFAAESGRFLQNLGNDDRLADATRLLNEVVFPRLDRRFEEFITQVQAQSEDRANLRRRAIERHRDTKSRNLTGVRERHRSQALQLRAIGNDRKARQHEALAVATEGKLKKLLDSCARRLNEIDAECEPVPEVLDVAALFLEVGGGLGGTKS